MEKAGVWIFLITAFFNPGELLCFYKSPLINVNVRPVLLNQVKEVLCDHANFDVDPLPVLPTPKPIL